MGKLLSLGHLTQHRPLQGRTESAHSPCQLPVTLDHAMVSRLDRIARGCHLHSSSMLSGLIAEGLESLETRLEYSPSDLRFEFGAAVYTLRREIARQRMWELFQTTQCCVVPARRQAEREVSLPAGTLDRPKPQVRPRRDHGNQDARKAAFVRPRPPARTDGASNRQHPSRAEGQGGGFESVDVDECAPRSRPTRLPCVAGDARPGGAIRSRKGMQRSPRSRRHERSPPEKGEGDRAGRHCRARVGRTSFVCSWGWVGTISRARSAIRPRTGASRRRRWRSGTRCGTDTSGPCVRAFSDRRGIVVYQRHGFRTRSG